MSKVVNQTLKLILSALLPPQGFTAQRFPPQHGILTVDGSLSLHAKLNSIPLTENPDKHSTAGGARQR